MNYSNSENHFIVYGSNSYEDTSWQPKFLDDGKAIHPEYKNEWRTYLFKKNLEQMSASAIMCKKALRFSFYSKIITRTVFDICKSMKQPPEVRYLSLDILDRFLITHFFNVAGTVVKNGRWNNRTWKIVTTRMINQSFLRIITSIQLASKYCNNFRALSTKELQNILKSSGLKYFSSKSDLQRSEARIFQAIGYTIPVVTPLTYIEMFCEDFDKEEIKNYLHLSLSSFLNVCIDILDVVMIFHKEIFHSLYTRMTGKPYLTFMDSKFLSVEGDYVYLAATVIYTSAVLQDPAKLMPKAVLQFFTTMVQYKPEEIESLGNIILEIILNEGTSVTNLNVKYRG